ncbi:MAG: hypothetical protein RQ839_05395 [Thermoproteus sp.]|jgi:hypothetical protein|nr:hypothetical protein [Thermoproteus sp.]MDT7881492.1 hypothetical protein [Thermoproteus sp.]
MLLEALGGGRVGIVRDGRGKVVGLLMEGGDRSASIQYWLKPQLLRRGIPLDEIEKS